VKLTEQDRKALLVAVFPAIVALKLTKAPSNREGDAKSVSIDFAAAVWAKRYVETLAKVLEQDDTRGQGGSSSSGFPS
jgi:hypothetical protein